MSYPNGQVPFSVLIHLAANFWLPPGTAARWLWLVAEGQRRFGVTFRITPDRDGLGGWNAYRPLSAQILYRKHYGNMAAVPKFSSHGGFYRGQEVFAIDVDNWSAVKWEDFAQLCADAGFRVNFVTPEERWHIGDFNNPWQIPAFTGSGSASPSVPLEDDEMYSVNINGNEYGVAKQFITHYGNTDQAEITRKVTSASDELHNLNKTYGDEKAQVMWAELLDGLGIPRDALNGKGLVKNPQSDKADKYEKNGTWSREREILAALKVK